jgi:hypothetical protein
MRDNFAGQYQQAPSPQGGGMVKTAWFRNYPWFKRAGREPQDWMWQMYKQAQARGPSRYQ